MRRLNLLYIAGLVVMALSMARPSPAMAALYGDYLSSISTGSLNQPAKVAVDQANGNVYVTDSGNKLVKEYDVNGNYISTFSLSVAGTPVGIAVNASNIFVGDSTNKCVWIYDKTGNLTDLAGTGTSHKLGGASGTAVKMPNSVAIAPSGHIFVADGDSDSCYIYNADGSYNSTFGGSGTANGNFYYPSGIAFGASTANTPAAGQTTQYFYVGDQGNYRVEKFSYVYNATTKAIVTAPAFAQNVGLTPGTRQDAFGSFLRISDLATDNTGRLIVLDSLQMVGQIFQSDALYTNASNPCADASGNVAINYCTSAVVGNLNVPTGVAADLLNRKIYVTSNQSDAVAVYNTQDGLPPTVNSVTPSADVTPVTTPYTINFTVSDPDSSVLTVNFYYYNTSTPNTKVLIGTATAPLSGGTYSGSYNWDWTLLPLGTYKVHAEAIDEKNNTATLDSTGNLLVVSGMDGCTGYTNADDALYGLATADPDGDGLSNCEEVTGVHPDPTNHYTSNPLKASTDGTGMTDLQKRDAATLWPAICTCFLNPNTPDTDGGGVSDWVEIQRGTNPCNAADDTTLAGSPVGAVVNFGSFNYSTYAELTNTSDTTPVTGDLELKRTDGTIAATVKGIYLAPHAATALHIQDYTAENNLSMDFVTFGSKSVVGTVDCYPLSYTDQSVRDDYFMNMDATGATTMETGAFNDGKWNYYSFIGIRNPSLTDTVDATITYYDTTGTVPTVNGTATYTLQPATAVIINPTGTLMAKGVVSGGLTTGGQYNASIQGYMHGTTTPANVVADMVVFNTDPTSGNVNTAVALPAETQLASTVIWDTFNDGAWGYQGWASLKNPGSTPATATVTYYNQNGTLATCTATANNPTGANPVTKTIQPHQALAWEPVTDGLAGGQHNLVAQSQGGTLLSAYGQFFQQTGGVNNFMIGFIFSRNPLTIAYIPYWRSGAAQPGSYTTYYAVRNYNTSPINFTAYYYDTTGNLFTSVAHNNIAPNAALAINPYVDCGSGTMTQGSIKVVATDPTSGTPVPFTGWILRTKYSSASTATNVAGEGILESAPPQ